VPYQIIGLLLTLLASRSLIGDTAVLVLALIINIGLLAFEWFIARQTFRFSGLACAAVAALDFSIAVVVESAVRQFLLSAPAQ